MARVRGRPGSGQGGVRIAGLYRILLQRQCEEQTKPDPRWYLSIVDAETRSAQKRRVAEGRAAAEVLFDERLAEAEPIIAMSHHVREQIADPDRIPWLRDRSIHAFTVHDDDTITPRR